MKRALEDALAQCLARLEEGASIEECLHGREALAEELRPLLEAAKALRGESGAIPEYTPQAAQRGRSRMHAARTRQAEGGGRAPWAGLIFWRPLGLAAVAVAVAVLAALGFTTDLLRFDAGTTSADVEGVVSRIDPDVIRLLTDDGQVDIRIGENTVVLDASGNVISGGDIVPGRPARVEVEEEDGAFAAQRIEVEDDDEGGQGTEVEFSGVIKTVSGSTIAVQASFGVATVHIDSQTEVKGTLAVGATVEVHATLQGHESYLARQIEVKGADGGVGDDAEDREGSESSGSGSSGSSSDDNQKDGDEKKEEEDH